jgi:hypothetical protein
MKTKAGVWIDHKQAAVVLLTDAGQELKRITTSDKPTRTGNGARAKHTYAPNDFAPEDRRERKLIDDRKKVFEEVLAIVRGADSLLILGPGEAKAEFRKHIMAKKLRGLSLEVETTDKLTDRQLIAKVGEHFANVSKPRKKVAVAASTKRPVKAATVKRATKAKK